MHVFFDLRQDIYKKMMKIPIKKVPPTLPLKGRGMRGTRKGGSPNVKVNNY